ncbi:MAG: hypothetical protein JSR83_03625 [Proteobacteria bacterium]|nr:hypothetical protein [Pseudomonadota bacterium]
MNVMQRLVLAVMLWLVGGVGWAATLRVGPNESIRSIAEAARVAKDGDVVEIVAANYQGDAAVAVWPQAHLTIRGVGGRPVLVAAGQSAEGKGIWVVRGTDVLIENIVFRGARVPDLNGSGIRHEQGRLTVRNCLFDDNEMGILTANRDSLVLIVEDSEFSHGVLATPRLSHLLYAGRIARLEVRGSYFHHGLIGHLLKSRARFSLIEYNRLTDENGGRASYELEFPNGGVAIVIGNLIQQSVATENKRMIAFGAEGLPYERNSVVLSSNTLVDGLSAGGEFLKVWTPERVAVRTFNNLLVRTCNRLKCVENQLREAGSRIQEGQLPWRDVIFPAEFGNRVISRADTDSFLAPGTYGFQLEDGPGPVDPGSLEGVPLVPRREYVHSARSRALPDGLPAVPGAFQP